MESRIFYNHNLDAASIEAREIYWDQAKDKAQRLGVGELRKCIRLKLYIGLHALHCVVGYAAPTI